MGCFEDIIKFNNNFDETINTIISRFIRTENSEILVTESANLAASYAIKDGLTPIESWSFPQLNGLRFPLVVGNDINDGNQYVFAVQEPNSLTKWPFGERKQRIEKHFFKTKIISLIPFVGNKSKKSKKRSVEPIVVFENGFCQSISNAIQTKNDEIKQNIISEDEMIQFIDGLIDDKSKIIFLITKEKTSTYNKIKSIYKLTLNMKSDVIEKTERQSVVNQLTNWTLCHKSATILSVTRLRDQLVVLSFDGKTETQILHLNSTSIESVYSLGTTSVGSICLIGKTKDNKFSIELWELKYGSKLDRMALPFEPLTNDCKVIDNKVFITCFKGIVLVPIKIQSISLSQIVGKNKNNELVLDSNLNQRFNQICSDFETKCDQSFDEINESFIEVVRQIGGNLPEELILKLLIICSTKLSQTNSESLKWFFEKLVSLPFNELFMISKLKSSKLKSSQILSILESLTQLLPSNNCAIIDWISILIDSHINEFIINPNEDTIKVIEQIQLKINGFCLFCEELDRIKTHFELILSKNVVKSGTDLPKAQKGQYSIESLKI